jgi:nucleotide-binding universal stress UspA family protein
MSNDCVTALQTARHLYSCSKGAMMYKAIVVHVDGSSQQASRLRAAARLAREQGAHLVGSTATGISWLDLALPTGSKAAPVPPADFTASGIPARVRRLPEHIALHGARPVLVVTPGCDDEPIAGTAVAGWHGSTQGQRALAAALPLLQRADNVRLARINPDLLSDLHGEEPGVDMAPYLARHGVKVDVVLGLTHATAGGALLALARDWRAGLVVAGAYGHGRYREWTLGGATRELLERTPVPLPIAHRAHPA